MKNIKRLVFVTLITLSVFSCSKDEEVNQDPNTSDNFTNNPCSTQKGLCCGVIGRHKIIPGKKYLYELTSSIESGTFNWEVNNSSMVIVSAYEKYAYVQFNSNFTSGKISVYATDDTGQFCNVHLDITKQ